MADSGGLLGGIRGLSLPMPSIFVSRERSAADDNITYVYDFFVTPDGAVTQICVFVRNNQQRANYQGSSGPGSAKDAKDECAYLESRAKDGGSAWRWCFDVPQSWASGAFARHQSDIVGPGNMDQGTYDDLTAEAQYACEVMQTGLGPVSSNANARPPGTPGPTSGSKAGDTGPTARPPKPPDAKQSGEIPVPDPGLAATGLVFEAYSVGINDLTIHVHGLGATRHLKAGVGNGAFREVFSFPPMFVRRITWESGGGAGLVDPSALLTGSPRAKLAKIIG